MHSNMLHLSVKFEVNKTKTVGRDASQMPFFPYTQDQIFENGEVHRGAKNRHIEILP